MIKIGIFFLSITSISCALDIPLNEIFLKRHSNQTVLINITKPINYNELRVIAQYDDILKTEPVVLKDLKSKKNLNLTIFGLNPGHSNISFFNNETKKSLEDVMRVTVFKSDLINYLSTIFGWIYFAAWSISFYPQMYTNYERKSVVGLNFDFLALNLLGFTLYSIYNISLFSIQVLKDEYSNRYTRGVNPVQIHDILFAVHAGFVTILTIFQCFIYERNEQRVSNTTSTILVFFGFLLAVFFGIAYNGIIHWLDFIYVCSYIKLVITLIKYIPQALMNYKRKSTIGWSIGNIFLDLTGGVFSMIQMFILAYNYDDWMSILGDFTKFGLGLFSLSFDIFFIIQHYVLYKHTSYNFEDKN